MPECIWPGSVDLHQLINDDLFEHLATHPVNPPGTLTHDPCLSGLLRDAFFVHLKSGTRVYKAYSLLDDVTRPTELAAKLNASLGEDKGRYLGPWGFQTLGGAGGQTVMGALTTGTHGGDFRQRAIADAVLALHLVADGGDHYWIEPANSQLNYQLTDDAKLHAHFAMLDTDVWRPTLHDPAPSDRAGVRTVAFSHPLPSQRRWSQVLFALSEDASPTSPTDWVEMAKNSKQTSSKAATAASKVLRDGRTSVASKTAAASALSQKGKGKK